MKVAQDNGPALISNAGSAEIIEVRFGDSVEAQNWAMRIVADMIYTNKPEAVWREYGCNAADAHIEAGRPDAPIEITLPSRMSAEAVIRDFGNGMTEGRMRDVYSKAGESTKRGDNTQTGTIGIGAKAGFAYGDMFTVTSWNGGIRTVYQFFKEKGAYKMMKVAQGESDAPDGTEIRVPVKAADLETFKTAAEKTFRYFRVSPIVHGGELVYKRGHAVWNGEDWAMTGDGKPVAIMGNVGYTIDPESLGLDYDSTARQLLEIGVELHFEIGDLEIAATREALQYKDETKAIVIAKAERVVKELAAVFKEQIASSPNLWEAKKAYAEAFEKMGSDEKQTLRELIDGHVTWKGHRMENGRFELNIDKADETLVSINSYVRNWRGKVSKQNACDSVIPHESLTIVVNDLPKLNVPQSRVRGHFARGLTNQHLVVLTFRSDKARDNFWKANQMDGVPTIPLSSLPPLLTANSNSSGPSAHRSKHSGRAFVLDEGTSHTRYNCKVRSAWWSVEQIDKQKGAGVYVVVRAFKVESPLVGADVIEPYNFVQDVRQLRSRSLITGKVYAFKRDKDGNLPKLGPGWKHLEQHIADEVTDWCGKHAQKIADFEETRRVSALLPCKLSDMLPDCIAREAIDTRELMHDAGSHATLADFIRGNTVSEWCPRKLMVVPQPSVDLAELQKKVLARYPMLAFYEYDRANEKELTTLCEYIKLVEQV